MEAVGVILTILVVLVIPAVVTCMKNKFGFLVAGLLLTPIFIWVGSVRLAKPGSHWYCNRYGYDKRKRSWERFEKTPYEVHVEQARALVLPERPVAA